jgi:hypothetical protein
MLFLLSKNVLFMWISAYPLVENKIFLNVPLLLWVWYFAHMYLAQLGTRTWSLASRIYVQKLFFSSLQNTAVPLRYNGKKTFSSTLNVMILQVVRNESVRFGGHIGIQVSYKILQLELVLKESPILNTSPSFQQGLIWGSFGQKHI